jgi:hypothetical protein
VVKQIVKHKILYLLPFDYGDGARGILVAAMFLGLGKTLPDRIQSTYC